MFGIPSIPILFGGQIFSQNPKFEICVWKTENCWENLLLELKNCSET